MRNTMGWSATTGEVAPWVYQAAHRDLRPRSRDARAACRPQPHGPRPKMANRLIEAHERHYWTPDAETLDALRRAGDELEDRVEGVVVEAAA